MAVWVSSIKLLKFERRSLRWRKMVRVEVSRQHPVLMQNSTSKASNLSNRPSVPRPDTDTFLVKSKLQCGAGDCEYLGDLVREEF